MTLTCDETKEAGAALILSTLPARYFIMARARTPRSRCGWTCAPRHSGSSAGGGVDECFSRATRRRCIPSRGAGLVPSSTDARRAFTRCLVAEIWSREVAAGLKQPRNH